MPSFGLALVLSPTTVSAAVSDGNGTVTCWVWVTVRGLPSTVPVSVKATVAGPGFASTGTFTLTVVVTLPPVCGMLPKLPAAGVAVQPSGSCAVTRVPLMAKSDWLSTLTFTEVVVPGVTTLGRLPTISWTGLSVFFTW